MDDTFWGKIVQRAPAVGAKTWCLYVFTGRMPRSGKLQVLNLLTGLKSGFSPRRGDSLHRFMSNLAGTTGTRCPLSRAQFPLNQRRVLGMRPQKYKKNFHFLVNSRPAGATPLTDFEYL